MRFNSHVRSEWKTEIRNALSFSVDSVRFDLNSGNTILLCETESVIVKSALFDIGRMDCLERDFTSGTTVHTKIGRVLCTYVCVIFSMFWCWHRIPQFKVRCTSIRIYWYWWQESVYCKRISEIDRDRQRL